MRQHHRQLHLQRRSPPVADPHAVLHVERGVLERIPPLHHAVSRERGRQDEARRTSPLHPRARTPAAGRAGGAPRPAIHRRRRHHQPADGEVAGSGPGPGADPRGTCQVAVRSAVIAAKPVTAARPVIAARPVTAARPVIAAKPGVAAVACRTMHTLHKGIPRPRIQG